MKTIPQQFIAASLLALALATLNPQLSTCLAQGSLTPPGSPAPTMKTLAQIEARTPISSAPFTINVPGSFYLTTNLTVSAGDAITINTNGVTLDLSGFTLSSTAYPAAGHGVRLNGSLSDINIANGHIRGGVTNNAGTYNGPGFAHGIRYVGAVPVNTHVVGIAVSGCSLFGINFGFGNSTLVESCTVRTVGSVGIQASMIKNSTASDCGSTAISGSQVTDCRGESSNGLGLSAGTALNCYGYGSGINYGLFANTAQNCIGSSTLGVGLYTITAQNCIGTSESDTGLHAVRTAIGCFGESATGLRALYAQNASTCIGSRPGGRAIEATVANGCFAAAGTNFITYKYNMP